MSRLLFTNEDYLNLILIHGECGKVIQRTLRCFQQRYPDRPKPSKDTVQRIMKNLIDSGSFKKKVVNKARPVTQNEDNQINVIAYFTAHPSASVKDAERDLGIKKSSILKILHNFKFHAFSLTRVHNVKETDYEKRIEFCETMLLKLQENNNFLDNFIWSDEAKINKNGIFNRRNIHYWSNANPHVCRERNFQESWSFNIYCAIKNDSILVLYIYNENLTGTK